MIMGIRQKTIVGEDGKIEVSAPQIPCGTYVEVIVLLESETQDTTDYLMATQSNREHLQQVLRELDDPACYITVDPDEL